MTTERWAVAIYFNRGGENKFHAWIDLICASTAEFGTRSACTLKPERMKVWRTKAGAARAAAAYERNNPGARCFARLATSPDGAVED